MKKIEELAPVELVSMFECWSALLPYSDSDLRMELLRRLEELDRRNGLLAAGYTLAPQRTEAALRDLNEMRQALRPYSESETGIDALRPLLEELDELRADQAGLMEVMRAALKKA